MDPLALLKGVAPAILFAIVLVSLAGNRLLPLAMALGFGAAYAWLKGWPRLPHELWVRPRGTEWLVWGVLATGLSASFTRDLPRRLGDWVTAATAMATVWLMLSSFAAREGVGWSMIHVGGGVIGVAALAIGGGRFVGRAPNSPWLAPVVTAVLSADAVLLVLGQSALLGQLGGATAAAVGAAVGTALWRRPFTLDSADGAMFGALHGLFLLAAVHLAYLSWPAALLAAAAPMLPLMMPRSFAEQRPKRWLLVSQLLIALPLGVAVAASV